MACQILESTTGMAMAVMACLQGMKNDSKGVVSSSNFTPKAPLAFPPARKASAKKIQGNFSITALTRPSGPPF